MTNPAGLSMRRVIAALETIAPPSLAESWDRTGLLLSPSKPGPIRRILIAIDLTDAVLHEAQRFEANLIVAYHPPLFDPIVRLTPDQPREARLIRCIESGLAIYSPHTALDAAEGGVNDWLADGVADGSPDAVRSVIPSPDRTDNQGPGRLLVFERPITRPEFLRRVKRRLALKTLRVAKSVRANTKIRSVALCAGSGFSALNGEQADVYFTGEMKHHDILSATARGIDVVLAEHTHTERGYLPVFRQTLSSLLDGSVTVRVARADREPVEWE